MQKQLNELNKKLDELRISKAKWRALVEFSQDYILSIDLDRRITFVSRFELGWTAANTVGKHVIDDLSHPDFKEAARKCFDEVLATRKSCTYEYGAPMLDGSLHYFNNRVAPVIVKGELIGYNLTVTDITPLIEAQNQLRLEKDKAEAANRAKSTFLANMSHELRTPLNSIIGYSEYLADQCVTKQTESFSKDLNKINKAGKNLLAMINELLDISSIEAGRINVTKKDFEISALIEDVANTIQPLARNNGNKFVVSNTATLGTMSSDVAKLRQCLLNLLANACKFTEKGNITLNCLRLSKPSGEFVSFEVIDSGVGIPEHHFDKIFEAFAEQGMLSSDKHGGRGLGLAISRRFCRLLGGDIRVESVVGKGSKFTLEVPAR
jgi:PAS domain S-box-containing protein